MPRDNIPAPKGKAKFEEIVKCGTDPIYFMKRYVYISHPKEGLIKFDTYGFQDECVKDFETHRYNIVLKSRQLGLSTVCAAYCLWLALFQKEKNILVIATKLDVAKNFLRKIMTMYDSLPDWLVLPREKSRSVKAVEFSNGSRITAIPTGDDAGRSEGVSLLVVDEAAHIQGFDEIWQGLYNTVSTGGNIILLSCVTKDTYVHTTEGPKQIADFIPPGNIPGDYIFAEPYSVQGYNAVRNGKLWHNQGVAKTKKITTRLGSLEGSLVHKLWSCKEGKFGWHEHQELKVGDWIAHYGGQELWGSNDVLPKPSFNPKARNKLDNISDKITPSLAYLFGLYLAEGSQKKNANKTTGMTITCGDDISKTFEDLGLTFSKTDKFHYNISSSETIEVFQKLGFDFSQKAPNKIIPARLLEMSRNNIIAMLQGIFDGDGTAHKTTGSVSLTSKSPELIKQVRMLLSNFGIWSTLEIVPKEKINAYLSVKNKHKFDTYKLEMNGKNAALFYEKVGFRLTHKQERREMLTNANLTRSTSWDVVPHSFELAKELIRATGIKPSELGAHGIKNAMNVWGHKKYKTDHISREMLLKLYELAKHNLTNERKMELEGILHFNVRWSTIQSISDGEAEVYDFSLPDNSTDKWAHSVIYGNFLGHQTPKGVGNVFHKTWLGCDLEKKTNDFHGIKLPWTVHPEHDDKWFQEQCRNLDPRGVKQELLCDFLGSGQTYLHETSLSYIYDMVKSPIDKFGDDGNIWVWKYPVSGHKYIISADVARGDSDDYSTCHVVDTNEDEVVAEYQGKIPPDRYAELLADLGYKYYTALICPENNTFGLATAYRLRDLKYPNLYYEKLAKSGIYQTYSEEEVKNLMPGLSTTVKNRQAILAKLEEVIRNKKLKIYSSRFAEEAKTFIWNTNVAGGRAQAMKGYNDDLIMSLGIACYLYDAAENKIDNDELNRAMLAAWGKSTTRLGQSNQEMIDPGSHPTAFQKVGFGSQFNQEQQYYNKEATQQNMKPGVSLEQAKPNINIYNVYAWLFK